MAYENDPGVGIKETAVQPGPIQGVSAATGVIIGETSRGPANQGKLVHNMTEYDLAFGVTAGAMRDAAEEAFKQGLKDLYVIRMVKAGTSAVAASLVLQNEFATVNVLRLTAKTAGAAGNSITVKVEAGSVSGSKVTITDGTTPETYDNVASGSALITAISGSALVTGTLLTQETLGTLAVTNLAGGADSSSSYAIASKELLDHSSVHTLTVSALNPGVWGNDLSVVIGAGSIDPDNTFSLKVYLDGVLVESDFDNLVMDSSDDDYVVSRINGKSNYITIEDESSATTAPGNRPATGTFTLTGGAEGPTLADSDYITSLTYGTSPLDEIDGVINIAVPGRPGANQVVNIAGETYCENRLMCHFIASLADNLTSAQVATARALLGDAPMTALYWPWYQTTDLLGTGSNPTKYVSPVGAALGCIARTVLKIGAHKAAAGMEDGYIKGALGIRTVTTAPMRDTLTPLGVNCLRLDTEGVVIWGARTLARANKWKFLNVRMEVSRIEMSLSKDFKYSVFDPADETLWSQLKKRGDFFLTEEWKNRALKGKTAAEAFQTKCDSSLNTDVMVENGRTQMQVVLNPTRPAERIDILIGLADGTISES